MSFTSQVWMECLGAKSMESWKYVQGFQKKLKRVENRYLGQITGNPRKLPGLAGSPGDQRPRFRGHRPPRAWLQGHHVNILNIFFKIVMMTNKYVGGRFNTSPGKASREKKIYQCNGGTWFKLLLEDVISGICVVGRPTRWSLLSIFGFLFQHFPIQTEKYSIVLCWDLGVQGP